MRRLLERWFGAPTLDRDYFEQLHLSKRDPWNFETSSYELWKRHATIDALPRPMYDSALEIGCSIGVFTALLAARCQNLLSVDVAEAALVTARARCRELSHVRFARIRVPEEFPEQSFDLIVLSEIGYFWSRRELHRARRRLVAHLHPDGHLLLTHWTGPIPESPSTVTGDDVHNAFIAAPELRHCYGVRETAYRLDLFERHQNGFGEPILASFRRLVRRAHRGVIVCADLPLSGRLVSETDNAHRILIRGWAGAREPIKSVSVTLDEEAIGQASYGHARLDVAAHFPEFGEHTGFSFELRPDARLQGPHVLQVTALSETGRIARTRHDIDIRFRAPAFEITPRAVPDGHDLARFLEDGERLSFASERGTSVSVIIVLHNRAELTLACLRSLLASKGVPLEVIIVDNASSDATAALLDRIDGATILRNPVNLHYLRAVNLGARVAAGEYVLLLNNDTEVSPDSIATAVSRLDGDSSIGVVGGRLVLYSGRLQEAGGITWRSGRCLGYGRGDAPDAPPYMFVRDVDYCAGAFLLTPRALFQSLGGLAERYAPGYYEDADYCFRVRQRGQRVVFDPRVITWHLEHGSYTSVVATRLIAENHSQFEEHHRAQLAEQWTQRTAHVGRARARGVGPRILVIGDEIPLLGSNAEHTRVRQRLQSLADAGFTVTFHPLSSQRVSWTDVYRANPDTIEFMNEYGAVFLGPLLEDRAGEYAAFLLASSGAVEEFDANGYGHDSRLVFDAWAANIADADRPSGLPCLRGPNDMTALFQFRKLPQLP